MERGPRSIVCLEEGELVGDREKGEALAQSGHRMRFTDYTPARETGGNRYAWHQLTEVNRACAGMASSAATTRDPKSLQPAAPADGRGGTCAC
jgi:hypothetical protein